MTYFALIGVLIQSKILAMIILYVAIMTAPAIGMLSRNRESLIVGSACAIGACAAIFLRSL